jgi:hypothetical protein
MVAFDVLVLLLFVHQERRATHVWYHASHGGLYYTTLSSSLPAYVVHTQRTQEALGYVR